MRRHSGGAYCWCRCFKQSIMPALACSCSGVVYSSLTVHEALRSSRKTSLRFCSQQARLHCWVETREQMRSAALELSSRAHTRLIVANKNP